ncbi:unnamed protein product [Phytophthora fragariaefolia]|uniref:Unnamed protein product n=1 Tax=Phytophthora fragariaefolia TaxID=1490495 RepID=A0A9W6XUD3_9STRA|nr:unnamed protein product [Phytophthora fragariaefolia]
MLVSQFTQVLISRGEYICRFGETGSDMFFIFAGIVDVLLPAENTINTFPLALTTPGNQVSVQRRGSHRVGPTTNDITSKNPLQKPGIQYSKVNELKDGDYFGENGLFTNGIRNACVQAQTSCILYKLSRESMELVFARYPAWKEKVFRIASIHREKYRLLQKIREEQRRGLATSLGLVLSRADLMNERAEQLKEEMDRTHTTRKYGMWTSMVLPPLVTLLITALVKPFSMVLRNLICGVPAQSPFHIFWLRFMVFCTVYIAIITPYQLAIDSMDRLTIYITILHFITLICEVAFIVDLWFSGHVLESNATLELYGQRIRSVYKKDRITYDFIAAIPFYGLLAAFNCSSRLKLLRCIKLLNVAGYLDELSRAKVASELTRFGHIWLLFLLVMYWGACAYLSVAMEIGFGTEWESWLPSKTLEISDPQSPSSSQLTRRLLRGFFFAITVFIKKARNIAPDIASAYAFQIAISFIGLLTMSFVIGELTSLFISRSSLEIGFRKNHIAVTTYLERARVSDKINSRTRAYMSTLWASHAGVNYDKVLADMPREIRSKCILHASKIPLNWFIMKVITPIGGVANTDMEVFTVSLAEHLHFEAYSLNEEVITEGTIVRAMYFVTKGFLYMKSSSLLDQPIGLRDGSYFGERGLLGCTISAYTVRTVRACDIFSLNSKAFAHVLEKHEFSRLAIDICNNTYKALKRKCLANCTKTEMEEYWGAALLDTIHDFHIRNISPPTPGGEGSAEETKRQPSKRDERYFNVGSPNTVSDEETPAISAIFECLNTSQSCFEAFAPLLYIILPNNPLDASVGFNQTLTL